MALSVNYIGKCDIFVCSKPVAIVYVPVMVMLIFWSTLLMLNFLIEKLPSCSLLPTIENGSIISISNPQLSIGTRAVIHCKDGYAPLPPISTIVCNSTLQWKPNPSDIVCEKLPNCKTHPKTIGT